MSSRRQRRKQESRTASPRPRIVKWLGRLFLVLFIAAILVLGGGYLWLGSWLRGEGFRRTMSDSASEASETRANFTRFDWSGGSLKTESFIADGDSLIQHVDAKDLRVDLGLGAAWHGVLEVDDARVRSLSVDLDSTVPSKTLPASPAQPSHWYDRFVPQRVDLKRLEIANSSLKVQTLSGPLLSSGTSWKISPDQEPGSYQARANGGQLTLPGSWAPPMELGMASLRYADDTLFLNDADFRVYDTGRLDLSGEMSLKGDGYHFSGDLHGIDCSEVLRGDWKKRLEGAFNASFTVRNPSGVPHVSGKVNLSNAVLTALPVLDTLAAYADTVRFRRISLQEAHCTGDWEDGALQLRDIVLFSRDLARLEGSLDVTKDGRLDGRFRLGMTPGVLSAIPGAETEVFVMGERQLLWAPLHITGTLDHPEEDLSSRLIEAAGMRIFEDLPGTGEHVLKFSHTLVSKALPDALNKGADLVAPETIEQGKEAAGKGLQLLGGAAGAAKDVTGDIFNALAGHDEPPPPKPQTPPPPKQPQH